MEGVINGFELYVKW